MSKATTTVPSLAVCTPKERAAVATWINTFSFTVPTAIYAVVYQRGPPRSFDFNVLNFIMYQFLYMVIHDTYFYW